MFTWGYWQNIVGWCQQFFCFWKFVCTPSKFSHQKFQFFTEQKFIRIIVNLWCDGMLNDKKSFFDRFLLAFGFLYSFFRKIFESEQYHINLILKMSQCASSCCLCLIHCHTWNLLISAVAESSIFPSRTKVPLKVAQSQKLFQFGTNLPKKVSNPSPKHVIFKWIVLRGVFWRLFWDLSQS